MKSYIKIYGPLILKSIRAWEKIDISMPEVSIMDATIGLAMPNLMASGDAVRDYFIPVGEISTERRSTIISKLGMSLGGYDFYFEWFKDPNSSEANTLIQKIDAALAPLGCKYTIITK